MIAVVPELQWFSDQAPNDHSAMPRKLRTLFTLILMSFASGRQGIRLNGGNSDDRVNTLEHWPALGQSLNLLVPSLPDGHEIRNPDKVATLEERLGLLMLQTARLGS